MMARTKAAEPSAGASARARSSQGSYRRAELLGTKHQQGGGLERQRSHASSLRDVVGLLEAPVAAVGDGRLDVHHDWRRRRERDWLTRRTSCEKHKQDESKCSIHGHPRTWPASLVTDKFSRPAKRGKKA